MLAALKPQLLAETALEVSHLREKEFKYYESHISMLQTYATLLAGFAFATFVSVSEPLSTSARPPEVWRARGRPRWTPWLPSFQAKALGRFIRVKFGGRAAGLHHLRLVRCD